MAMIILQLDPAELSNPDLDIRYILPDLMEERSGGRLKDGGYDYVGGDAASRLLLFLETEDADAALPIVIDVLGAQPILENDLSKIPVAIDDGGGFRVVHPAGFSGTFSRPDDK